MSDGTPGPATWPRWRGPLAYGQATATRIFCGVGVSARSFTASRRVHDHTSAQEAHCDCARQHEEHEERDEHDRDAAVPLVGGASRRSRAWRCRGPGVPNEPVTVAKDGGRTRRTTRD